MRYFKLPLTVLEILAVIGFFLAYITAATANYNVPTTPQPVKGRISGSDIISDVVPDGIDTPQIPVVTPTGFIDLTWSHPTTNTDGSTLLQNQIIGYDIEQSVGVSSSLVTRVGYTNYHTITSPSSGVYLFRIRTVAQNGVSTWSTQITVLVP